MFNLLDNKTKFILSTILIITTGLYIVDKTLIYKSYKKIKDIDKILKKNSWEYYD